MPMTSHPTALIVEDEAALADELREQLQLVWPALRIVGHARSGEEALRLILAEPPDIVFLDIQIPAPNGLQVARIIRDRCHIVFVTAYDAHALEAFDRGAVDYLLKPVVSDRLATTVQRLQRHLPTPSSELSVLLDELEAGPAAPRHLRWLTASVGNAVRLITVDDIVFFQAAHKSTRVVLADADVLIKKSLKELLAELDPTQFWQTHRSTIVNALHIASISPKLDGELAISLKSRREQLPVSEAFVRKFRQM
jgi:DNA-binding LytR/AlgR family response regulator